MITRLALTDFQCHESLDVQLDPRITTLVGPSDVGKSSVLRSLRWLGRNRPLGDGFIRHGTKQTTVKLRVDDQTVVRRRGKGENSYKLGGQQYEAFGNDVPPAVAKLLNVGEVNFAGQHDAPFWFDLTPGEVARQLNKIVDLEAIDKVSSDLGGRVRVENAKIGVVEERLEKARQELTRLAFVPVMDAELKGVEQRDEEQRTARSQFSDLLEMVGDVIERRVAVGCLGRKLECGEKAVQVGGRVVELLRQGELLSVVVGQIENVQEKATEAVPDLRELGDLYDAAVSMLDQPTYLRGLYREAYRASELLGDGTLELRSAKERFAKEMGGRCPICGGPIDA